MAEQALPDNFQEQIEGGGDAQLRGSGRKAAGHGRPHREGSLSNLYSLLSDYGVSTTEGIVVEGTGSTTGYPYVLLPRCPAMPITDPTAEGTTIPTCPSRRA